jgi:hypothetical protein
MLTVEELRSMVYRSARRLDGAAGDSDGPVFTQYRHNARGAIAALKKAGGGVAIAALYHPDRRVGDIDLRWGRTSDDPRSKGLGLAKLIRWHPEVLNDLQGFIASLQVHQIHKGVIHLWDGENARAAVRLEWNGKTAHWLVTAYVKKKSASIPKDSSAAFDHVSGPDSATPNNADTLILWFAA